MARNAVSISIEVAIAPPKQGIKPWQTEDCVERPGPPDSPCHIEIRVGARFQRSVARQYPDVVEQVLSRDLQGAVGRSGLQVFNCKTSPGHDVLPEPNPAKAKATSAVVKYPAFTREGGCRFMVCLVHRISFPLKTTTGDPAATNALSGCC